MVVCLEGCVFHECLLLLSYSFIQEKKYIKKQKQTRKKNATFTPFGAK